jgi:hypothetical protein
MFKGSGAGVGVFDLNGASQPATVDADALDYITGPLTLRCNTDNSDKTIVVNPNVPVSMVSPSSPAYFNITSTLSTSAIFQVLGGAMGNKYEISLNGAVVASYTPPSSTEADARLTETSYIATILVQMLTTNTGGTVAHNGLLTSFHMGTGACIGWTVARSADVIFIQAPTPQNITVSVSDGAGGENFKCCTHTVTDVADLPRFAPHYYVVRIAENSDSEKDLWFKFIAANLEGSTTPSGAGFGNAGYWQEAVSPGTNTKFNAATMPHKLTYDGTSFRFSKDGYTDRTIGTTTSNPDPSFVGNKINDVSSFQGRTVFLSGSNVIMSRTNRPINFWRGSASALADTDPIDINSTVDSSPMLSAVQYNKDLALFTPKGQHVAFGRTALTPQNAVLVMTTKFESEPYAHPVSAGRNVFFATNFGRYTGIREFFSESTSDMDDSRPVTQHVNRYIVGKTYKLTASANYETLLVHTDNSQTEVYVYQYIWSDDNKKVQSAWHSWRFEHNIVHSFFDEDVLYIVQNIGTDYYLLRMPLDVQDSAGIEYPVYLDQRFDVFDCEQSFVLPFDYLHVGGASSIVCVQGANCPNPGLRIAVTSVEFVSGTGYVVTLKKDMQGGDIIVGKKFLSRYMPTMPSVKDQNGVVIGTAKTRAKTFNVSLDDTGYIAGKVTSKYGPAAIVEFNARIVGDVDNVVGEQPLSSGTFAVPFRQDVNKAEIELYSDSHLPMTLADIEYEGQYTKRGRRIANTGGK